MESTNVRKAGRCWNGAHRDSGTVVHIVPEKEPTYPWFTKALCGAQPGRSGYGWTGTKQDVNCPKCLKKKGGSNG